MLFRSVKNSFGSWETVPFVREDGVWKIDKLGYANQMMKEILNRQKQAFDGDGIGKQNPASSGDVDDAAPLEELPKE